MGVSSRGEAVRKALFENWITIQDIAWTMRRKSTKRHLREGVVVLPFGGSRLLTASHDDPLGLLDHPEQVFYLYILDEPRVLAV
jgi:hypothetical protein